VVQKEFELCGQTMTAWENAKGFACLMMGTEIIFQSCEIELWFFRF
jgi:hypothetical protein